MPPLRLTSVISCSCLHLFLSHVFSFVLSCPVNQSSWLPQSPASVCLSDCKWSLQLSFLFKAVWLDGVFLVFSGLWPPRSLPGAWPKPAELQSMGQTQQWSEQSPGQRLHPGYEGVDRQQSVRTFPLYLRGTSQLIMCWAWIKHK